MADQEHASSWAGDPAHMPDGHIASVNELTAPKFLLGQGTVEESRTTSPYRQEIPGSHEVSVREQYAFQSAGEPGYLGQDTDDYGAAGFSDSQRPTLPNPEFPGESGTTNAGQQGDPIDWNGVAPYKYGEYPKDNYTASGNINSPSLS